MGLFRSKPKITQGITVENLGALKEGMSAKDAIALVGEPQLAMDSAEAFIMMGAVPKWAIGKQNWVYQTPHGDFQLIVQDKRTVAEVLYVESLIEKMSEGE